MSCANTNLPECMMRNRVGKLPVSQRIHIQIGDTPKHTISYSRPTCYITVLAKLPDTTEPKYKDVREEVDVERVSLTLRDVHFS